MGAGIVAKIISGLGDGASRIMGSVATLKRINKVDKTMQENNIHAETVQMMKAYANEIGKENKNLADSIIDFVVRLPRPLIAYITIALLLICLISPSYAKDVAMAFSGLPTMLYYIIMAVITFYFGGRMLNNKFQANKPKMTAEQHTSVMTMVQSTEKKIIDSNDKVIAETSLLEEGLDDRGLKHIEDSEGWKDKMYKCPAGFWTIGYGVNLQQQRIPKQIGKMWLIHIVKSVIKELVYKYPFIENLDTVRYWIIIDMAYNLGVNNTKTLQKTINTLYEEVSSKRPNYRKVARVMKSGKWFKQVGNRSKKLVKRMETGKWV